MTVRGRWGPMSWPGMRNLMAVNNVSAAVFAMTAGGRMMSWQRTPLWLLGPGRTGNERRAQTLPLFPAAARARPPDPPLAGGRQSPRERKKLQEALPGPLPLHQWPNSSPGERRTRIARSNWPNIHCPGHG
eukprot:6290959-Alexandrium_andersonii.AAC.1